MDIKICSIPSLLWNEKALSKTNMLDKCWEAQWIPGLAYRLWDPGSYHYLSLLLSSLASSNIDFTVSTTLYSESLEGPERQGWKRAQEDTESKTASPGLTRSPAMICWEVQVSASNPRHKQKLIEKTMGYWHLGYCYHCRPWKSTPLLLISK